MKKRVPKIVIGVRVGKEIKKILERAAEKRGESLSAYIAHILTSHCLLEAVK